MKGFSANLYRQRLRGTLASACGGGERSRGLALPARLASTDTMTTHRTPAAAGLALVPPVLATWLSIFRDCFTAPVWKHVLVLVAGAVLAPRKRTVSAALRVMGLVARPGFARYREVLIGIDDTIERRWGARIKARGIYRDPVRSSHGHFVKASGLRWLSLMVV